MPDKRDMHKAKSHRNSKSAKQHQPAGPPRAASGQVATDTMSSQPAMSGEPTETLAPEFSGKKNKSRR
jgi:hypothetical protein